MLFTGRKRRNRLSVTGLRFSESEGRQPRTVNRKPKNGFTFVELLIVTVLLAVISMTAYAVFAAGVRVWHRVNRGDPFEDIVIFFDKFGTDLRNSFKYTDIAFRGDIDSLKFSTISVTDVFPGPTVGSVIYTYDAMENVLYREGRDYSKEWRDSEGVVTEALSNVTNLRFRYYHYDKTLEQYIWLDEWSVKEKALPLAVRVNMNYEDEEYEGEFVQTFDIPAGG